MNEVSKPQPDQSLLIWELPEGVEMQYIAENINNLSEEEKNYMVGWYPKNTFRDDSDELRMILLMGFISSHDNYDDILEFAAKAKEYADSLDLSGDYFTTDFNGVKLSYLKATHQVDENEG